MSERMTCACARELMMIAELEELAAEGESALALHLRTCDACRAQAAAVLRDTTALQRGIAGLVSVRTSAAGRSDNARVPVRAKRTIASGTHASSRRVVLPVAAAAILAMLLTLGRGAMLSFAEAERADVYHPPIHVPAAPAVNAGGGSGVAVMQTSDPKITVVWTF